MLIKSYVNIVEKIESQNRYAPIPSEAIEIENILFRKTSTPDSPPPLLPLPDSESVVDCVRFPYRGMHLPMQTFTLAVIATSRDSSVKDMLKELLLQSDSNIKNMVAKQIVSMKDTSIVPFILKEVASGKTTLSSKVIYDILTGLPDIRSIEYFRNIITCESYYTIAQTCIKIGLPTVPMMRTWLTDTSVALRACASRVLGELDYPSCKELLLAQLDDTNSFLRVAVIEGMTHAKDTTLSSFVYRLNADTGNNRIRNAIEDYNREEFIWVLEHLLKRCQNDICKGCSDTLLLNDLLQIIVNEKTRLFQYCSNGTQGIPGKSTCQENILPFLDICLTSTNPECKRKAFEIKSCILDSKANPSIRDGLNSDDPSIVMNALRSIVDSNDSTCYTFNVALFNDTNYLIRYYAAIAASRCTSKVYVPYLVKLLHETNTVIPKNMIRIENVHDSLISFDMDIPNCNKYGEFPLKTIADAAAYALGNTGDKSVTNALYRYLTRCDYESKTIGLAALKKISTDLDIKVLKHCLADNIHSSVREMAMGCLFHQDISKTKNIMINYITTHSDIAAVIALKCLYDKSDDDIFHFVKPLLNIFSSRNERFSKLTSDEITSFWEKSPQDTIQSYDLASRLLIQSAIEILHGGQPNGIVTAMNILGTYSYDCCGYGETWLDALERVPQYTNTATIDSLVAQLKNTREDIELFEHYVDVLNKQKCTYAVSAVANLLKENDSQSRITATRIIYNIADTSVISKLELSLYDSLDIVKLYAFSTLYNMNAVSSAGKLLSVLNSGLLDTIIDNNKNKSSTAQRKQMPINKRGKFYWPFDHFGLFFTGNKGSLKELQKKQPVTQEFHTALFDLVQKGNLLAEHYIDYSQVQPDSMINRMLYSNVSSDRLLALKVYLEHPGTVIPSKVVELLDDNNLEIQIAAGRYLLIAQERSAYENVYRYISYMLERFPLKDFSRTWNEKADIYSLIELCTDTSAIRLHKMILHLKNRELRYSSYKALLKMDNDTSKTILSSPTITTDMDYIKSLKMK